MDILDKPDDTDTMNSLNNTITMDYSVNKTDNMDNQLRTINLIVAIITIKL